jgi:hypothetical protein
MKMLLFNYSPELDKRITNLSALPQLAQLGDGQTVRT